MCFLLLLYQLQSLPQTTTFPVLSIELVSLTYPMLTFSTNSFRLFQKNKIQVKWVLPVTLIWFCRTLSNLSLILLQGARISKQWSISWLWIALPTIQVFHFFVYVMVLCTRSNLEIINLLHGKIHGKKWHSKWFRAII